MCRGSARILVYITLLSLVSSYSVYGQDKERPLPPFLENVTVDPLTGYCTLLWTPGGSSDVAGYVFYNYEPGFGNVPFDTIYNPSATTYVDTKSNANLFSVNYTVAAIDSSENTSPLSNDMNTLFITATLDSCNHGISVVWNSYNNENHTIDNYTLYSSLNGGALNVAGTTQPDDTALFVTSIITGSEYCFIVEASVNGSLTSTSNKHCINTDLVRAPDWINGDFATVEGKDLKLSFSFDQLSEIGTFRIEQSDKPYSGFSTIQSLNSNSGTVNHILNPLPDTPMYYRMSAINSCGQAVVTSNPVSIIIGELTNNNNSINIYWSSYLDWYGGVARYTLFRNSGDSFIEIGQTDSGDTTWVDDHYSFMYDISGDSICYLIIGYEGSNPYYSSAESRSAAICTPAPVNIFSPTIFTPNGDGKNDTFRPIMSFTPKKYKLVIKSRSGATLFESSDHLQEWTGLYRGIMAPKDVYLWFLEVETMSGGNISRHGTITIF